MVITLGEASRRTGKSKAAIIKAIGSNRLSASKSEAGQWQIDPAELFRVYPPLGEPANGSTPDVNTAVSVELAVLRERCGQLENQIADLREDRDRWRAQAEKAALILTDQRPQAQPQPEPVPPPRRGLRGWLHRITA
jgi:hypothetical protein